MAAHSTTATQPALALADLRACTDTPGIFALFRKLRYPIEEPPVAVPLDDGDLPGRLRDAVAARYLLAHLPGASRLSVTLFVLRGPDHMPAYVRGIAQAWTRRFPGDHLLVFAARDVASADSTAAEFQGVVFVNARRLGEGAAVRIKLHKLLVDRKHATRHDLETLNAIALTGPTTPGEQVYRAQCAAFDVERMTDAFYKEYARRFREVMARIKADNRGIAAFQDPDDHTRLHTFTQRLFGRLMFLYFLQKKGALNGEQDFISRQYIEAVRENINFYSGVLEPLFFDTLNRPREGARSTKFGRVPYLNGGLFAADEDDYQGKDRVHLDDAIFDTRSPDGLLYFLNTHNFTIEEDTPLEVQVALDPEMLGKVFENLLEAEERGKNGTFYTPRPVVAFMCREALASYLATAVPDLSAAALAWLLDEAETGEAPRDAQGHERLGNATLSRRLREEIERALAAVRVLDPAVGSGAFPLGMLALIIGVRRALYRVAGADIAAQSHLVEGWKRDCIRDCLYGVDVKREAIEIARLRLWLSLVVDADPFDMEPLPNLDYKLMDGDSLIETFDGVPIFPTRPAQGPAQPALLGGDEARALVAQLHALQDQYFQPDGQVDRLALRQRIRDTEYTLVEQALRDRQRNERDQLENLMRRLANLAGKPTPPALAAEQQTLTHSIATTDSALRDLRSGKPLPFFLYRLHFASVFAERDGFDIVIANPPYVRHEKIAPATLKALKAAYPAVAHGMADLYVYFYARALQLLRAGGTLCFISSNKFFRAGYGKGLRDTLQSATSVRLILDFGDFPVFDAAAYPCIVIAANGKPAPDHAYRGLTAGSDIDLDKLESTLADEGQSLVQTGGARPPSGSSESTALTQKLVLMGIQLGKFVGSEIYYGIKTGLNQAFVIDQRVRDQLVALHPASADVLRPFVRGRDVDRYALRPSGQWLIRIENGWTLPAMGTKPGIAESAAWAFLQSRYPAVADHLAPFADAARKRDDQGQFWWELRPCVYYAAIESTKILYPDIASHMEFAWDDKGHYLSNTSYFLPTDKRWLCALLNSNLVEFVYASLTQQIRGGYFRFFTQYVEQLPIVEPADADKRRLEALVDQLQAVGGQGPQAEAWEREVDAIVYRTYGLTRDEIAEIERWHDERRALLGKRKNDNPTIEAE